MKELKLYTIYKITNKVNGKVYIGQTCQNPPELRFKEHKRVAKAVFGKYISFISRAIKKYGEDNFMFEVLEKCYGLLNANELEINQIELHKSFNYKYGDEYGYNLTVGGGGANDLPSSKETKEKLSNIRKKSNSKKPTDEGYKIEISIGNKKKKNKIQQEIKDKILKAYDDCSKTQRQLAELFGLTYDTVRVIIKNRNKVPQIKNIISEEEQDRVVQLKNKEFTHKQISKKLNITENRVQCVLFKYNQKNNIKQKPSKRATEITYKDIIPEIMNYYDNNILTRRQLCDKYNLSLPVIAKIIKISRSK